MQLSILIPSIPSRWEQSQKLYTKISKMCEGKDIEILLFLDNKKRSVGGKRDALVQMSRGKYFMFVDDDDDLVSVDEIYQATFQDVDVITFKQLSVSPDKNKTPFTVTFGLGNPNELNINRELSTDPNNPVFNDCKRPPYHVCAWNQTYKKYRFPESSYGEDWQWVQQCIAEAKTEVFIDKVLHRYNYDQNVSEAPRDGDIKNSIKKPFSFIHRN
jgi:hypothetical protein